MQSAADGRAPLLPLWCYVVIVLERGPALSIAKVALEVARLSGGRFIRVQSTSRALAELRGDGCCVAQEILDGRRIPTKLHALTPQGRELLKAARAEVFGVFERKRR